MGARNGFVFNIGPPIKSDASRAATYSKRKKGLLKKVKELSILCGVDVAVMCHHPHMAGAAPLLWGQPNLNSVLSRYKGVAPEEREKRKLDNTTFLHNQVQKVVADLQLLADQNRKLANQLENSLWDDRLNAYSAAELQQVVGQVFRKKKEVADLLAVSSSTPATAGEGPECNEFIQDFNHLTGIDPVGFMGAVSTGYMLQSALNEDVLVQQLMCRMPAFRSSENAAMATHLHQSNVMGATMPNEALCSEEPAGSENSIVSGRNEEPDQETPGASSLVSLSDAQSMFATSNKGLDAVDALEDEFGSIGMEEPTWYGTGMPTTSTASDASEKYTVTTNVQGKMPYFNEFFDIWPDAIGFAAPATANGNALLVCQANQSSLQPEAALMVPHVN